jgi:hypothetical protein
MKRDKKKKKSKRSRKISGRSGTVANKNMNMNDNMDLSNCLALKVPFYIVDGNPWMPSDPEDHGAYEGREWAKVASLSALQRAAERLTIDEQINQHQAWCNQCEISGQEYNGDLCVTSPAEFGADEEVMEIFQCIVRTFDYFQGYGADIKIGKFAITGIPSIDLRWFENGWTDSVRKHWDIIKCRECGAPRYEVLGDCPACAGPVYEFADHFACYNTVGGTCNFKITKQRLKEQELTPDFVVIECLLEGGGWCEIGKAVGGQLVITHVHIVRSESDGWDVAVSDGLLLESHH